MPRAERRPPARLSVEQEAVLGAVRSGKSVFFTGCAGERLCLGKDLSAELLLSAPCSDGPLQPYETLVKAVFSIYLSQGLGSHSC